MSEQLLLVGLGIGDDADDALLAGGLAEGDAPEAAAPEATSPILTYGGGRVDSREFHLKIYSSLETGRVPLADMDINAEITDLRWNTNANGFADLECGMAKDTGWPLVGYLPVEINTEPHAHVEVWYGSRIVYEGRLVDDSLGAGGLVNGFLCDGYLSHLSDDWNRSTSTTSVSSGNALQQIVQSASPYLRFGNSDQFIDPNITHSGGLNEWRRMTAGEVADQIIKEGNSDGYPVDVAIWENRTLWCLPRTEPLTPHYRIPFDERIVQWRRSYKRMASHVTVEYGDGSTGTLTAENETGGFLDRWKFTKKIIIPAGDITATAATAFRDRELTTRATPEIAATVSLIDGELLTLFSGAEQPQELVRSLEWVQVGDEPMQPIVGTTLDATARSLTLELGAPSPIMPKNLNIRERDAVARLLRNVHPTSGGRTR